MSSDEEAISFEADFCIYSVAILVVFVMRPLPLLLSTAGLGIWCREERSGSSVGMVVFYEFVEGGLVIWLARLG